MEEKSVKRVGLVFSMISAVAWGSYGVFSTSLLNANVREIFWVGLASAALFVYFGIRVLCTPQVLKGTPLKYCICLFLQGLLLFNGMNYSYAHADGAGMPMGIVSIVAFCNVLVVLVLSYFLFGYKFTMPKIRSLFLAILGLSMVLDLFGRVEGQFTTAGLFWTALIPLFFGTNMVINKYFMLNGVDTDVIMFCVTLGASP